MSKDKAVRVLLEEGYRPPAMTPSGIGGGPKPAPMTPVPSQQKPQPAPGNQPAQKE
jgi:hypothetical protein